MTYYPGVPVRDPRVGTSGERSARVVCIVITAIAVVVSALIAVTTQTSVSHESATAPPRPGQQLGNRLRADFPLPAGTTVVSTEQYAKVYRVRSSLAVVKAFYLNALRARGAVWQGPTPEQGTTGTTGWDGIIVASGSGDTTGLRLTIGSYFPDSEPAGTVPIRLDG
ncbi:hypothetical protein [uncultured Jatrophihabitans sp.]|uniref:hypothetical protein n=1 Tax=uncultured Jatrophihabitans sp. TaxID=1610747 RepID=UPI0035CA401C